MAFDHRGNSGDSFRETVGEDITDLELRVRFAGTIIGIAPVYPSEYPPPPLRVQRIVLMNQIENINFLFHHDEYEPACKCADIVELTLGACRKSGSLFVGLFLQEQLSPSN